jgi:VCBS repeat-containing protein
MAKESPDAKKSVSGSDKEKDKRLDQRGDAAERQLKKARERPIGEPERAREEAPIGWDFGPDGPPLDTPGTVVGESAVPLEGSLPTDEIATASLPMDDSDAAAMDASSTGASGKTGEGGASGETETQADTGAGSDAGGSDQATGNDDPGFDSPPSGGILGGSDGPSGGHITGPEGPLAPPDAGNGGTGGPDRGGGTVPPFPGDPLGPDSGTGEGPRGETDGGGPAGGGPGGPGGGIVGPPPGISGPGAGGVQEDVVLSVSGRLEASGSGDLSWSIVGGDTGSYGGFVLGPDGSWSYALDNEVAQGLMAGESVQEIFTVRVTDASGASAMQTVTVTISGSNDAPVIISGTAIGLVQEDEALSTSGQLVSADPDINDTAQWSVVGGNEGAYGSFTLTPDGSWTYLLDNDKVQGLKAGETADEIFTVTVTDSAGASDTQTITIGVTGTNDVPVISGAETGIVQEDEDLAASGTLTVADRDIGDTAAWSVIGSGDGQYGSFFLDDSGSWSYTLVNDAAQGLKAGETVQEIFTVTVTDAEGASDTRTVTVTVTGTNDAPVISRAETGIVQEDDIPTASGALAVSDADIGDTASWSVVGPNDGHYGSLALDSDGAWSYTLDNATAQGLKAGETAQEIFTVTVTDSEGASATQTITITVIGTNDAPVISGTATGAVGEDETLTAAGQLTAIDTDIGDSASWSVVGDAASSYGALTLNPDGSWSYALDNDAAQGLKVGQSVEDTFVVRVIDAEGASAEQAITVTVSGTNDTPVISGASIGSVQEDGNLTASGTLTAADADTGDTATWSVAGSSEGAYGSLTLGDDGSWTYTLNDDSAQGLKVGDTAQEIFTVTVTDSAGASTTQTVSITVTGTNDTPVISGTETGAVREDEALTASGTLTSADADIGDTADWSIVGQENGAYGSLTLGDDGRWSYALDDDAAQGLKAGDTAQEIFTVKVTDSAGAEATQTITVTVTGTNDAPVISGTATGSVGEDGTLAAGGKLDVADADIGDTATWSVVGDDDGAYGGLMLNQDGSWSYTLDNDRAQGLKAGDTAREIFTVKVTDAAGAEVTQTITVSVTGTNDIPVISGAASGSVEEDGTPTAAGRLDVSDADIGDTATWSVVGGNDGNYGALTLDQDGNWSYALDNNKAQGLKAGETTEDSFVVRVTDGSGAVVDQLVTVTVTGTNDMPVISGTATGIVQEDLTLTAEGKLDVSDADIGDTANWSLVGGGDGRYGSLTLNDDSTWSYTVDNDAVQGLKAGDSAQDIFTVKVTDSTGAEVAQTITVTVNGTNDVPVISGTATATVQEDGVATVSGALAASDADTGDTATWSVIGGGDAQYGSLTLNDDGTWSYTLDNDAAQSLKAGDTAQEIFTVKVTDAVGAEATQTITVTVAGTNDTSVISGTATGSVDEDGTLTAGGKLDASDVDIGDSATWSLVGGSDGSYGSLTLNADGSWSYALDNDAAQGLKAGDAAQDIFTVKVTDSAGAEVTQTITVTVNGTNDAPVISGAETGAVQEDGTLSTSGALTGTDADIGDTATWSVVGDGSGDYGGITLNDDGTWSYALDNDKAQGLKAGDTAQEIFTVKVTDASGAYDMQTVTVTVTGTNDIPVISGNTTGSLEEDAQHSTYGILRSADVDIGDKPTWSLVGSGESQYGTFEVAPSGILPWLGWSYNADEASLQHLGAGETVQDIFTVRVTDAAGATVDQQVTITIRGTNDAPVISGTATGTVAEDDALSAGGQLTATDPDIGDTATWSMVGDGDGSYGALVLNSDGSWTYTLDNDAAQGLKAGDTVQEIFTVKVTDAHGATDTQIVTVTVAGTNDAPVMVSWSAIGFVAEDEAQSASGTLMSADPDIGDTATWSAAGDGEGVYGSFTLNPDGTWSYALDNDKTQGLKAGDTAQEIFTVKVTDAAGAEATQTITVTVTGTNDAPVISGTATGSVDEDATLTAGGKLDVSDADIGDTAAWSVVGDGEGAYGNITLNQDGTWSYVLDNGAAQGLKAGDTAQEIFTVKVTDAAGAEVTQTITVTVTGTNDTPAISGTETGTVAEDETSIATGSFTVTDADSGDTADWSLVGSSDGSYGSIAIGTDGNWSYALNNDATQGLKAGETVQEIFTVKATDVSGASDTQTVTITVTGTNDVPVISGIATGSVQEDGTLMTTGKLDVFDADTGDTATWCVVGGDDGNYGSLTIDESGRWSYTLDNGKAQGLKEGETAQETFTVRVTDSDGASVEQTITVTVGGTNDVPVISGTSTGQVREDVTLTASGTLTAADADMGDTASWSVDGSGISDHGVFAIDPDSGHWTFTLDNDSAQGLKAGESIRETFTVTTTDSSGASESHLVSVEITGTNDGPVVDQALNNMGSMKEDTSITFSADDLLRGAQVTDIDQDHLTITTVGLDGSSAAGTLVDNGNGTWTFTPDHNVSNANVGIVFQVSDGHTSVSAQATVEIQPVADPADVTISSSAVQEVIKTGPSNDLGRIVAPQITTTKLPEFTLEFTVVGNSVPESTTGAGPVIVNLGSPPSDKNVLTLWDPANMKVGMSKSGGGDVNIATGIDLTDGQSHRVTVTYDGATNTLRVYDNGDLALTTQLPKSLPNSLYMAVAEKANTPPTTSNPAGSGYRANEHFEGTIFNVAMSNKAETAEQVKTAPLAEQADDKNLLIDLRSEDGKIVDTTGRNSIKTGGSIKTDELSVDTDLGSAPAGAVVHLDIDTNLSDPNDHISSLVVSGFVAGTVVSDGVHSVTITSPTQKVDITDWSRDNLTADLPDGVRTSMDLKVTATTTTPPYETGELDAQGNPVLMTNSATSDEHHTLMIENAGPPPVLPDEEELASTGPDGSQPDTGDAVVVPGDEVAGGSENTTLGGQHETEPGAPAEGDGTNASTGAGEIPGGSAASPSDGGSDGTGTIVIPGTEPPISTGDGSDGTSTGTTDPSTDSNAGGETTPDTPPPISAGGGDTSGGGSVGTTEPPPTGTQPGSGSTTTDPSTGGAGGETSTDTRPPASAGGGNTSGDGSTGDGSTGAAEPPASGGQSGSGETSTDTTTGDDADAGNETEPDTRPPLTAGGDDTGTDGSTGTIKPPTTGTQPGTGGTVTDPSTGGAVGETSPDPQPPVSAGGNDTTGPSAGGDPDTGETVPDTRPPASAGGGDKTDDGSTGDGSTGAVEPPAAGTGPDEESTNTGPSTGSGETTPDIRPPLSAGGGDTAGDGSTGAGMDTGGAPDGGDSGTGTQPPIAGGGADGGDSSTGGGTDTGTGGGDTSTGGGSGTDTRPPITDGTGGSDTSTGVGTDSGAGGGTGTGPHPPVSGGGDVAPPTVHEPVDATGDISFVNVNDWYNPSWGGGYNATFQLTITDDMLKDGGLSGWSLQISINNPNAVVTTGWLDGLNATVSFDPATGVFTTEGQDYQLELHAGDVIQFSIQVQNAGFKEGDFSFSFRDLDFGPDATASSPGEVQATEQNVDSWGDAGDTAAAVASVAAFGMELHSQTASSSTDGGGTAQPQSAAASAPAETTAHAEVGTGDGGIGTAQTADHAQAVTVADHVTSTAASVASGDQSPIAGQHAETLSGGHDPDQSAVDTGHTDTGHIGDHGDIAGAGRLYEDYVSEQPGHGEHGAGDIAAHAQPDAGPSSAASAYLEFVQPQTEDHGSGTHPADHPPSGADDYTHMVGGGADQPAHEPPPPDHLFADAQLEHGPASGHDAPDAHQGTPHDDAASVASEPQPIDDDHHHHHDQ